MTDLPWDHPHHFADPAPGDRGPVLPLYLNLEECYALAHAVGLLLKLSDDMLHPEVKDLADAVIEFRHGPDGMVRLERTYEAARGRRPVLLSLQTAIIELGESLERARSE